MAQGGDVKLGQLTRFIFTAPSWKRSLFLIILLGLLIDGANAQAWLSLPFTNVIAFSSAIGSHELFCLTGKISVLRHHCVHYTGNRCTFADKTHH